MYSFGTLITCKQIGYIGLLLCSLHKYVCSHCKLNTLVFIVEFAYFSFGHGKNKTTINVYTDYHWYTSIMEAYTRLIDDYWLWIASTPTRNTWIIIITISRRYDWLPPAVLWQVTLINTLKLLKTYVLHLSSMRGAKKQSFGGRRLDHADLNDLKL